MATPFQTLAEETRVARQSTSAAIRHPIVGMLPSLGGATGWLDSRPLGAEDLRGKVVLPDVWTYTFITWLRTLPYVRAWAAKYDRSRGPS
jgi:hypothetical protein